MHLTKFVMLGLAYHVLAADASSIRGLARFAESKQIRNSAAGLPRSLQTVNFVPLACNNNFSSCVSWSTKFGTSSTKVKRVVINCGECITMDHPGPVLTLLDGLDIRGKLIFPDNYQLEMRSTLIIVQGVLEMQSTKPVNGVPSVKFFMTGDTDQFFIPINENTNVCNGGACIAGKKAIVVAGGKVNSK